MAHSSHTQSSVSINLFNLPALPDARRQSMMFCSIPSDFFLLDGKNSRLSQIVNMWTLERLTPDGNEGVGLKIALDMLKMLWSSVVKLAKKLTQLVSTSNKRPSSGEMKIDLKRVDIYTEHELTPWWSLDELWSLMFTPPLEVDWSVISATVGVRWLLQLSLKCEGTFSHLGD